MSESCVAAIDQGTSSTRVLIISTTGEVLGSHQMEHKQHYPKSGHVEHDPLEIWKSVKTCLSGALSQISKDLKVVSIGITNQRETTVVWNKKTGQPYHNAIVWNDTRTGPICDRIAKNGDVDRFREKTGLPIASYFSATKLVHLLENVPNLREEAEAGNALFGTIDSWIIWRLTNGAVHATDVSNASRTMFMDLKTLQWDDEILNELKIPKCMLPTICPSSHVFGKVSTESKLAEMDSENDLSNYAQYQDIPIAGVLGDQNAALFGQACFHAGDSKCTYGTGAFMLFNTGSEILQSKHGLLTTVAYQLGHGAGAVYALEGSVAYSGSVVQWLRDNLGIISDAQESEALARSVPDNGGVYFVPAFAGLFAPYWRGDARGVITGLTAFNTKAHIVRAALEASAFQTVEVSDAMQLDSQHRMPLTTLRVDGGMTANALLMQFLSDLLNVPLVRPKVPETTALGAAFVAGLAVGLWKDTDELKRLWRADTTWTPNMTGPQRHKLMSSWRKALDRSLCWVDSEHSPSENKEHHKYDTHDQDKRPGAGAGGGSSGTSSSSNGGGHNDSVVKGDKAAGGDKVSCGGYGYTAGDGAHPATTASSAASAGVVVDTLHDSVVLAATTSRSRSSSLSTPLGTTGVHGTTTTLGDALPHVSPSSALGAVRHHSTAVSTPATISVPIQAVQAVRRSNGQKIFTGACVGMALGFGFMAGMEVFKSFKSKK